MRSPLLRWAGRKGPQRRWRAASVAAFALAGGMLITSGLNAHGLDLRAASVTDLDTVVRQERAHADDLQNRVAELNDQVSRLAHGVDDAGVAKLQRQVDRLKGPAGFEAVTGPGVTVTLDDAPKDEIDKVLSGGDESPLSADALLVHQQDIQAVVNALWAGGAEAITLQGQRLVSTTGIKCVGNTVVLQGVPYSPPYVVSAIGDPLQLQDSLDVNEYIQAYLTFVDRYQLGWDVQAEPSLEMPAYQGTAELRYAHALPQATSGPTPQR